jgi:hypothetical protein
VNVVLHSMGRIGQHITVQRVEGNLASKVLISAGTVSGMG